MEKAALELHYDFEEQQKQVVATLEGTQHAKGEEAQRIRELQKERAKMEEEKKEQIKLMQDAASLEREAKARCRHLESKEDEAVHGIADSPLKNIANGLTSMIGIGKVFDNSAAEKQAAHWKDKRIEALQLENEHRQRRHQALSRMTEFATKIKGCTTEENMADAAVGALHEAIEALK